MTHDAKCFSPCVYLHRHRQLFDNFIFSQNCPLMGRMGIKKRAKVMQNCCIRKLKVSIQMYSTRLMCDACFNNIVEISSILCSFMPYGFP